MKRIWEHPWFIWGVYCLAAVAVSAQRLALTVHTVPREPSGYENYLIFKNSFGHLTQGLNLYASYPSEQWDLFKYSPAFALFMGPFYALPDFLGLPLWNLLNALLPLAALFWLPVLSHKDRVFCAWFILPEMVVSLQNSQSNGLTLGLMLMAFAAFERARNVQAAGWIGASAFLKIFGVFAAPFALLYTQKGKTLAGLIGWTLFFAFVPLVLVSPSQLSAIYEWWGVLLSEDHTASVGLSVLGWLQTWFGLEAPKILVTVVGITLLGASLLKTASRAHGPRERLLLWASLLIWVVIFNHKAESPTFVIALCGAALWYRAEKRNHWETALLVLVLISASLTPTDIFPRNIREQIVQPYVLKAVPCIVLWGLLTCQILFKVNPNANTHGRSVL